MIRTHKTRVHRWALLALCAIASVAVWAQGTNAQKETPPRNVTAASAVPSRATLDKPVKDFALKDVMKDLKGDQKEDASLVSLSKFKDKKIVVLFFMSEQCSVTWRYEKRVGQLMQQYAKKEFAILGVRCSANDTPESIRKFAESKNFVMPVLNDAKGEMTAYFNVHQTPTFAVLDKKGVLRYIGSFDDQPDEPDVTKKFVPTAVAAVLEDKPVAIKQNPAFG